MAADRGQVHTSHGMEASDCKSRLEVAARDLHGRCDSTRRDHQSERIDCSVMRDLDPVRVEFSYPASPSLQPLRLLRGRALLCGKAFLVHHAALTMLSP